MILNFFEIAKLSVESCVMLRFQIIIEGVFAPLYFHRIIIPFKMENVEKKLAKCDKKPNNVFNMKRPKLLRYLICQNLYESSFRLFTI